MANDLLRCPFCGGSEIGERHVETYSIDSSYNLFGCQDCGAGFVEGSAEDWNRRAALAAPAVQAKAVGYEIRFGASAPASVELTPFPARADEARALGLEVHELVRRDAAPQPAAQAAPAVTEERLRTILKLAEEYGEWRYETAHNPHHSARNDAAYRANDALRKLKETVLAAITTQGASHAD